MKKFLVFASVLALLLTAGCGAAEPPAAAFADGTRIELSDSGVRVDGEAAPTDSAAAVYVAKDIVYYEEGHDFSYGEGEEHEAHSAEEAARHTVVHITKSGTYVLSGSLSKGQIAVDLGEGAEDDPAAVVTLVLDGVDIRCSVAPAVIFYRVYECADGEPRAEVDTTAAGANVVIADGTQNTVMGSHVARIYKPDSVVLSADGTEVEDAKKLHKYDAAFYSKMSMNLTGGEVGDGCLYIVADNEGLDSEMHLTLNGGRIRIESGNDGINTNEDGVSVTTICGGELEILVTGETGEGDGIDSNGWLVIKGGSVRAWACSTSGDAGIDSDMGIYLNGGSVIAGGNMLDRIAGGDGTYAVFSFATRQAGGSVYSLKNAAGETVLECKPENDFTNLIIADASLTPGDYSLWQGDTQLAGVMGGAGGFGGGFEGMNPPEGMEQPPEDMQRPEGMERPEGMQPPEGMEQPPEGMEPSDDMQRPEGMEQPAGGDFPGGMQRPDMGAQGAAERSTVFSLRQGGNQFTQLGPAGK